MVVFGENGEQRAMALRDLSCNTTLMAESLAMTLGLKGKEMDLEIQGVNLHMIIYTVSQSPTAICQFQQN